MVDARLIDFFDFMYNYALLDAQVFDDIRNEIIKRGVAYEGNIWQVYLDWYKAELGDDDE